MSALGQKRTLGQLRAMSALPPKADIGERDRQERRTVRITLTGYANRMRAFSIYTAPIGIRLSVICWEYGQFIAMIVFRRPLYPRNFAT